MSMIMFILITRACQQQGMKTLKQGRNWFSIVVESWWSSHNVQLMPSNLYGCFSYETYCSEDCSKIAKFWAKTTVHGPRSGDVHDIQRRSRFAQKAHNWWRIVDEELWHWNQSPIILMEAPKPKKAHQIRSNVKVLLTVFFDCNGVVYSWPGRYSSLHDRSNF